MRILNKFIISSFFILLHAISSSTAPIPTPWPYQFHSILFTNNTEGVLKVLDLWYDWPNGRNFNIIQKQLGKKTYDLDWTNGTKYFYTLDDQKECKILDVGFGILRPNWLEGATYLGQKYMDGFLCNVFTKVDFIWYYEDVVTKRPVYWAFYTGMVAHVITFEVGKVLEDPYWQAPIYCFKEENEEEEENKPLFEALTRPNTHGNLMRGVMDASTAL